jgi:hypothetical protein
MTNELCKCGKPAAIIAKSAIGKKLKEEVVMCDECFKKAMMNIMEALSDVDLTPESEEEK